jgi:hypothetical protein
MQFTFEFEHDEIKRRTCKFWTCTSGVIPTSLTTPVGDGIGVGHEWFLGLV